MCRLIKVGFHQMAMDGYTEFLDFGKRHMSITAELSLSSVSSLTFSTPISQKALPCYYFFLSGDSNVRDGSDLSLGFDVKCQWRHDE